MAASVRPLKLSDFLYYVIAYGTAVILKYTKHGISEHLKPPVSDGKLCFDVLAA